MSFFKFEITDLVAINARGLGITPSSIKNGIVEGEIIQKSFFHQGVFGKFYNVKITHGSYRGKELWIREKNLLHVIGRTVYRYPKSFPIIKYEDIELIDEIADILYDEDKANKLRAINDKLEYYYNLGVFDNG